MLPDAALLALSVYKYSITSTLNSVGGNAHSLLGQAFSRSKIMSPVSACYQSFSGLFRISGLFLKFTQLPHASPLRNTRHCKLIFFFHTAQHTYDFQSYVKKFQVISGSGITYSTRTYSIFISSLLYNKRWSPYSIYISTSSNIVALLLCHSPVLIQTHFTVITYACFSKFNCQKKSYSIRTLPAMTILVSGIYLWL